MKARGTAVEHTRAGGKTHRQLDQERTWKKVQVTRGSTRDARRLQQSQRGSASPTYPGGCRERNGPRPRWQRACEIPILCWL